MSLKNELKQVKTQAQYIWKLGKMYASTKIIKTRVKALNITRKGEVIATINDLTTHFNKYKDVVTLYFKTGVKVPLSYQLLRKGNSLNDIKSLTNRLGSKLQVVLNLDLSNPDEVIDYKLLFEGDSELYDYTDSGANLIFYKEQLVEGELVFHVDDYRAVISKQKGL